MSYPVPSTPSNLYTPFDSGSSGRSTRARLLSPTAAAALETDPDNVYASAVATGIWISPKAASADSPLVVNGKRSRAITEGLDSFSATKAALFSVKTGLAKPPLEDPSPQNKKKPRAATFADITGRKGLDKVLFLERVVLERESRAAFRLLWKAHGKEIIARHQSVIRSSKNLSGLVPLIETYLDTMRRGLRPAVEQYFRIEKAPKMGYGLFIRSDKEDAPWILIPKGTVVGHYSGILRHLPRSTDREKEFLDNGYLFQLDNEPLLEDWVIDAAEEGSYFRFANHTPSKGKAHNIEPLFWVDEEGPHIIFYTVEDVRSGDQLRFHYGDSYCWESLGISPIKA